jgi:hypothetical protein
MLRIILTLAFSFSGVCISAQELMTIREVFDFEVGDLFHYRRGDEPANATRLTILGKSYSTEGDTLFYTIERSYYNRYNFDGSYTFENYIVSSYYTNLDSTILTYKPELSFDSIYQLNKDLEIEDLNYDTIIENRQAYCNILINGIQVYIGYRAYEEHLWGRGTGLIKKIIDTEEDPGGSVENYYLFYFKKADCEFGTPDITNVEKNKIDLPIINIFPNPANNFVQIELLSSLTEPLGIIIYGLSGSELKQQTGSGIVNFDISDLAKGIYIIKIKSGQYCTFKKLIVV